MKEPNIIIYKSEYGITEVKVNLINDNVWLNQLQIASLFERDRTVITRHLNNIFKEGELLKESNVQKMHFSHSDKPINYYNLDVIISLGYRVKSKRGTQFRVWANTIIKEYIVKGFATNQKRLDQLKKTIKLINRTSKIESSNTENLLDILSDYSQALNILDDYDYQRITKNTSTNNAIFKIDYTEATNAIQQLRLKFNASKLFGNEKDNSFKSSIAVIDQTFDGKDLYPNIQEKAANLLYLVVKNHSFTDGNKRIAAWLFVWYLDKNNFLYTANKTKKIDNNTLVAITLMIALSKPDEKEIMINIISNLIQSTNE